VCVCVCVQGAFADHTHPLLGGGLELADGGGVDGEVEVSGLGK
jgi:hypothetical protein